MMPDAAQGLGESLVRLFLICWVEMSEPCCPIIYILPLQELEVSWSTDYSTLELLPTSFPFPLHNG